MYIRRAIKSDQGFGVLDAMLAVFILSIAIYMAMGSSNFIWTKQVQNDEIFEYNRALNNVINIAYELDWDNLPEKEELILSETKYNVEYGDKVKLGEYIDGIKVYIRDLDGVLKDEYKLEKVNI